MHVTTRFAAIRWKSDQRATGDYAVVSSFSLRASPDHPQAYGLFIGGANLTGRDQAYTTFMVREDGRVAIMKRAGPQVDTLLDWTANAAVMTPDAAGHPPMMSASECQDQP